MKYLVDTSVLVNYLRGKKKIDFKKIKAGVGISLITLAELYYGAEKSKNRKFQLTIIKKCFKDLGLQVINLNEAIISQYAVFKAKLEAKGERLDDFDLLIAATAKANNLTLVSENTSHFIRISGLNLIKD